MTLVKGPDVIVDEAERSGVPGLLARETSWPRRPLGDFCSIQNGAPFKSSMFNRDGEGTPLIRIRDVGTNSTSTYFSGDFDDDFIVQPGDLLVGMDGDFRVSRWQGPEALLNQRVCRLIVNQEVLLDELLELILQGYLDAIWRETSSTTVKHLSSRSILEIPLPIPPLEEQERIVEILGDQLSRLDTALESVHTVREKAAQFRRSLLHAAFTGALTGHDVEEGELPTDWRQVSLVELLADQKYALAIGPFGSNLKRSDYRTSGVPLVFVRNIRANDFDLSPVYVTRAKANDLSSHVVREGDVLVTKMGDPPGDTTIYPVNRPDAVITADCIKVTTDPEVVSNRYLSLAIGSPVGAVQIRQMTGGVAQQKVNLAKFRKFQIPLAPRREQDQIVEILEDQLSRLDASLAVADAVEERSAALRRSLLHSAFTGRLTEEWREAVNV
jgi:type I restriction enzyme, S subunit